MHNFILLVVSILCCFLLAAAGVFAHAPTAIEEVKEVRRIRKGAVSQHSFHPPLLETCTFSDFLSHWTLGKNAVLSDKYVRLTPRAASRTGFITNDEPVKMPNWEVAIGFRIGHPQSSTQQGADGFAFWYTKEQISTDGKLLGHPNTFTGLAVLVDTYENERGRNRGKIIATASNLAGAYHPAPLSADNDFADTSNGMAPYATCLSDVRRNAAWDSSGKDEDDVSVLFVKYSSKTVTVSLMHGLGGKVEQCLTLNNVVLPTGFHFQFSAATGGLSDQHDIIFFYAKPILLFGEGETTPNTGTAGGDEQQQQEEEPTHEHDYEVHEKHYSHQSDKEQRHAWRAKTPEELAKEAEVQDHESKEAERMREEMEARLLESQRLAAQRQKERLDRKLFKKQKLADLAAQMKDLLEGGDGDVGGGADAGNDDKGDDDAADTAAASAGQQESQQTQQQQTQQQPIEAAPVAPKAPEQPTPPKEPAATPDVAAKDPEPVPPPADPTPTPVAPPPNPVPPPTPAAEQEQQQQQQQEQQQQQQSSPPPQIPDDLQRQQEEIRRQTEELKKQQELFKAQQELFQQQQELKKQQEFLAKQQQEELEKRQALEAAAAKEQQDKEQPQQQQQQEQSQQSAEAAKQAAVLAAKQQKEEEERKIMEQRRREDLEASPSPAAASQQQQQQQQLSPEQQRFNEDRQRKLEQLRQINANQQNPTELKNRGGGASNSVAEKPPPTANELRDALGSGADDQAAAASDDDDEDEADDPAFNSIDPNADPAIPTTEHLQRAEEASARRQLVHQKKKREEGRKWRAPTGPGGKRRRRAK